MKKKELLRRIEVLESEVALLRDRPLISVRWPPVPDAEPYQITWTTGTEPRTDVSTGSPLPVGSVSVYSTFGKEN